jgi:hypothetical protein
MENTDLKRLPNPNTYEYNIFHLPPEDAFYIYPTKVYYKHRFIDGKGNITNHWSTKAILPENATLDDL